MRSSRNVYIGISYRGEVFKHYLAGSALLYWQECGMYSCNSIYDGLQCPSSVTNPALLNVRGFWLVSEYLR